MNLIHGKTISSPRERDLALAELESSVLKTLGESPLDAETVLSACDALSQAAGDEHISQLVSMGVPPKTASAYVAEAKLLLSRASLLARLERELGTDFSRGGIGSGTASSNVREDLMPLGTLLHITAGNQYALSFYSVVEGLLTGNINIVKLPENDDGLSAMILLALFKIEPRLAEYVYLFDYSSRETDAIEKLMRPADAVVVWGGDKAIEAIRRMAGPATKIIEWGHKLSFAYVTPSGMQEAKLAGLAENIAQTNQLLCSSCQGIFVDTDSMEELLRFCELFLPVLDRRIGDIGEELPIEVQAQTGLQVYMEGLGAGAPCRVYHGERCSLLAYEDSRLQVAIPYGNVWVKRLERESILPQLRPHKNHLQTAGLLCAPDELDELAGLLFRAGVIRVTQGSNMSRLYEGAAHDGEYPLRRYMKITSLETADEDE